MTNPIDRRTDEIADEIRANYQNEDDAAVRSELEFRAACFKCAVLETKLKVEQNLNREREVRW